jgi:hypothetical protein
MWDLLPLAKQNFPDDLATRVKVSEDETEPQEGGAVNPKSLRALTAHERAM